MSVGVLPIIFLVIAGSIAYRVTTPEERARYLQMVLNEARQARDAAARSRVKCEPFYAALRARMARPLVTFALAATAVLVTVMRPGAAPEALVAAGANLGTRTTNGEWWRLLTSVFVQDGGLALIINVAALVQMGLIVERLAGRAVFAVVFVASGVLAALRGISLHPVAISTGASAAVFGVLGLFCASTFWIFMRRRRLATDPPSLEEQATAEQVPAIEDTPATPPPDLLIPLLAVARIAPVLVVFVLYNMVNDSIDGGAELVGFAVGFVAGLALTRNVTDEAPDPQPIMIAAGVAAVITLLCAIPLRKIADVKPEIARVVAVEDKTSHAYQEAAERLKKGRMSAETLAQLIDRTIVPELQAADARIKALERVPVEHKPLVDDAEQYLRLRRESWQLRAEGLRKTSALTRRGAAPSQPGQDNNWRVRAEMQYRSNQVTLGKAEGTERASLEALERIRPAADK